MLISTWGCARPPLPPAPSQAAADAHRSGCWEDFQQAEEGLALPPGVEELQGLGDNPRLGAPPVLGLTGHRRQARHQHECPPGPCHGPFSGPQPLAVPFRCFLGCLVQGLLVTWTASPFLCQTPLLANVLKCHWPRSKQVWATAQGLRVGESPEPGAGDLADLGQVPSLWASMSPPVPPGGRLRQQDPVPSPPGGSGLTPDNLPEHGVCVRQPLCGWARLTSTM